MSPADVTAETAASLLSSSPSTPYLYAAENRAENAYKNKAKIWRTSMTAHQTELLEHFECVVVS